MRPRTRSSSNGAAAAAAAEEEEEVTRAAVVAVAGGRPPEEEREARGEAGASAEAAKTASETSGMEARSWSCTWRAPSEVSLCSAAAGRRCSAFFSSSAVLCIAAIADIQREASEREPASITSRHCSSREPPAE